MRSYVLSMAAAVGLGMVCGGNPALAQDRDDSPVRHVLLISVDGMHALDLARYVSAHPGSALARLTAHGVTYTQAFAPQPSDSFPGLLAQITGGSPNSTGVWYDDSYDRTLLAPGSTKGAQPGTEVVYDESIDINMLSVDGGGGIDPSTLPLDPVTLNPVYPHSFLRVPTIFEVVKRAGGRTAWCDKHLAYEIVNGPSGKGVDDLYTPEIAAPIVPLGLPAAGPTDPTSALRAVEANDELKVTAVLNEIGGKDHTGKTEVGVPSLFGMNFQAVSVGQKLAKDALDGRQGGYLDGSGTPTPLLSDALDYVDSRLGEMITALAQNRLLRSTAIIVSAKHGQAPIDINLLQKIGNPISPVVGSRLAQNTTDDISLIWLQHFGLTADQRVAETDAVVSDLRAANGTNQALGIEEILSGASLLLRFNDPLTDPRVPDVIAQPKLGVIYTHSSKKIAEHGGFTNQDRNVLLVISNPQLDAKVVKRQVETKQIAPTILALLGLNPNVLPAVRLEHTQVLPAVQRTED